ncbi:translation initiation factor 3 (if-3)-like protein [Hordeum vulgare]|nr:translation initiation factor 3 (if-3)-like protein [Hordeum vulgare]
MEGIIDNEIAHLVEVSEDWKVEQIVALEFMVEFPSTHMMRMANKSEKLSLLIHDIMTNIREAPRGKKACVTGHEADCNGRGVGISLGPLCMRFGYRTPAKLTEVVEVSFNGAGLNIILQLKIDGGVAPSYDPKDKCLGGKEKDKENLRYGDSIDTETCDMLGLQEKGGPYKEKPSNMVVDLVRKHKGKQQADTMLDQYGSNLGVCESLMDRQFSQGSKGRKGGKIGSGQSKKTMGRKLHPNTGANKQGGSPPTGADTTRAPLPVVIVLASMVTAMMESDGGGVDAREGEMTAVPKAKHCKVVPMGPSRSNSWLRGSKGNFYALQGAELLMMEKSMEILGHDAIPMHEALHMVVRMGFDLVEVNRKSNPPVCKNMDYHKEKYKNAKEK